jgi:hypothetical protein
MKKLEDLRLGDTVWAQKINRKDVEAFTITGEYRGSWIIGFPHWHQEKFPKKLWINETLHTYPDSRGDSLRIFLSEVEIAEYEWVKDNAYRISACVQNIKDAKLLREIARMVDYVEAK